MISEHGGIVTLKTVISCVLGLVVGSTSVAACSDDGADHARMEAGGESGVASGPAAGGVAAAADGGANDAPSSRGGDRAGAGGASVGGAHEAGAAGSGGDRDECSQAAECDDGIDCTRDSCVEGRCRLEPDSALCPADTDSCQTCDSTLGCVPALKTTVEMLSNAGFEEGSSAWDEQNSFNYNVVPDPSAQSGEYSALLRHGSSLTQGISDLYQWVELPERTVSLEVSGYYKVAPAVVDSEQPNFAEVAIYEYPSTTATVTFLELDGSVGTNGEWRRFAETASGLELEHLQKASTAYSLDLFAATVGADFRFDTLSLRATVCSDRRGD